MGIKLYFVFNEAENGGIKFDSVASASATIRESRNKLLLAKHKRLIKAAKLTEERQKEYQQELQYFELDNLANEMETYYKPFIINELIKLKEDKVKEINRGYDKCICCRKDRMIDTIREYFNFGYTFSVRPYAIDTDGFMLCFTKKYDMPSITITDVVLKDIDVCDMKLTFDTPREYGIITYYKGIQIGGDWNCLDE